MTLLHVDSCRDLPAGTGASGVDSGASPGPSAVAFESGLSALRAGGAVALVDDLGPYADCSLLFAAQYATTGLVSFLVRHTSGFIEVALPCRHADRLGLSPMVPRGGHPNAPTYGVAVDAAEGNGTGISAADRARTIALLGAPDTAQDELSRPGHVVTYRAHDAGVAGKPAAGEAACDLVQLAGAGYAVAQATLTSDNEPIRTARGQEAAQWSLRHGLPLVMTSTVLEFRLGSDGPIEEV